MHTHYSPALRTQEIESILEGSTKLWQIHDTKHLASCLSIHCLHHNFALSFKSALHQFVQTTILERKRSFNSGLCHKLKEESARVTAEQKWLIHRIQTHTLLGRWHIKHYRQSNLLPCGVHMETLTHTKEKKKKCWLLLHKSRVSSQHSKSSHWLV